MKLLTTGIILTHIFLIFLFAVSYSQVGWYQQTPPPQAKRLLGIHAINSQNVWAVGDSGVIIHSIDGGANWTFIPSGTTERLMTVEFINPDTGWVAGDDNGLVTTLLRTTDGGLTWQSQSLQGGGALPMYDIDFIEGTRDDTLRGFITGGLGYTYITKDFGANWNKVRFNCENTFWSMCMVNQDTGYFVGEPSTAHPYTIMWTPDGGTTWIQQTNPTTRNLRGVCFGSDQRGVAAGLVGTILSTSDGGTTWISRSNFVYRWESVFLTGSGRAWAVGQYGKIAYSNDWGYTWELQESGATAELWEVFFINENEGWIVGGDPGQPGVILHTTNSGITDIGDRNDPIISDYTLHQNYPNPFNPTTTIEFNLPKSSEVTLKIFNILGEEVETLLSDFLHSGFYRQTWNARKMPSGIYYYQLQAGSFQDMKKMILMK
jgi:photosystem II stability/assembly factor-like uncharacterized protein